MAAVGARCPSPPPGSAARVSLAGGSWPSCSDALAAASAAEATWSGSAVGCATVGGSPLLADDGAAGMAGIGPAAAAPKPSPRRSPAPLPRRSSARLRAASAPPPTAFGVGWALGALAALGVAVGGPSSSCRPNACGSRSSSCRGPAPFDEAQRLVTTCKSVLFATRLETGPTSRAQTNSRFGFKWMSRRSKTWAQFCSRLIGPSYLAHVCGQRDRPHGVDAGAQRSAVR